MFDVVSTRQFSKNFRKLQRKRIPGLDRLKRAIEELRVDPHKNDTWLFHELAGKHKRRVGDYRIVLAICGECRKLGHTRVNRCTFCEEVGDNTLVLFDVGHRSSIYGGH